MSPIVLRMVGETLYGRQWITPLAADLGVVPRTIARWSAGSSPINAAVVSRCIELLRARRDLIATVERAVTEHRDAQR